MKALVRKQPMLSIMPATRLNNSTINSQVLSGSIRECLDGWLQSVVRTNYKPSLSVARPITKLPRLTAWDVMRVNHATIREGESHCIWPPSIVQYFHTAEVITDKKAGHYELKDANLRRVG